MKLGVWHLVSEVKWVLKLWPLLSIFYPATMRCTVSSTMCLCHIFYLLLVPQWCGWPYTKIWNSEVKQISPPFRLFTSDLLRFCSRAKLSNTVGIYWADIFPISLTVLLHFQHACFSFLYIEQKQTVSLYYFLFIIWNLHMMYFDHIHPSCFNSFEIHLFPTHPTLCLHLKNNLLSLISDARVLLGV